MPTTSRLSLRYPSTSDTADVPRDIGNLASDIDGAAVFSKGTFANRPTSTVGSPGIDGRLYLATDSGKLYVDKGTSWVELAVIENAPAMLTLIDSQTFTSSTTYAISASAKLLVLEVVGAGGGGSGGARQTGSTNVAGGSGGAGGSMWNAVVPTSVVNGTVTVTVGAGGAAGTGRTGSTGNGGDGGDGGSCAFGSLDFFWGGFGAKGPDATSGLAGEQGANIGLLSAAGLGAAAVGGSGGQGFNPNLANAVAGTRAFRLAGGGGGGGSGLSVTTLQPAAAGGSTSSVVTNVITGSELLKGGGGAAGTTDGAAGSAGGTAGFGGGGGYATRTASAAGAGGAGAAPGGGGGGGGSANNDKNGGNGGAGSRAEIKLWVYG